jgi:hypothetical protein
LYFVAEGTLDVLLWDLLEKKFRDLGEFVEGKEKMKIVVHRTYDSIKDLQSIFSNVGDEDSDNDSTAKEKEDNNEDGEGLIKLEADLEEDITQLAQEEMGMIAQAEGDEEDGSEPLANGGMPSQQPREKPGQSMEDAICLSDDDDPVEDVKDLPKANKRMEVGVLDTETPSTQATSSNGPNLSFDFSKPFRKCRLFTQTFEGSSFGVQLTDHNGRLVVWQNTRGSKKPSQGDILVSVNGCVFPHGWTMSRAAPALKAVLAEGPVELTFIEDEDFTLHFSKLVSQLFKQQMASPVAVKSVTAPTAGNNAVIELLDDD